MKIYLGSDHGGFVLKTYILNYLENQKEYDYEDVFCLNCEKCDYPDAALEVCKKVLNDNNSIGILICGTGIGISMAANKINNINCALCYNKYTAEMAKKHNNANVIALGGRILEPTEAIDILKTFLDNKFEYGRHSNRLIKMNKIKYETTKDFIKNKTTNL